MIPHDLLPDYRAAAARDNVTGNPTICETLRRRVEDLRETARDCLADARKLRDGEAEGAYWCTGDARLRAAFQDGAS